VLPTPGAGEILLILLLVFIVFFGEKVDALGDAIGRAREEFRRGKTDDDRIAVKRVEPATVTHEGDAAANTVDRRALEATTARAPANEPREERSDDSPSTPPAEREDKSGA
jgi:Sec-independent protein translocase protein TatA